MALFEPKNSLVIVNGDVFEDKFSEGVVVLFPRSVRIELLALVRAL